MLGITAAVKQSLVWDKELAKQVGRKQFDKSHITLSMKFQNIHIVIWFCTKIKNLKCCTIFLLCNWHIVTMFWNSWHKIEYTWIVDTRLSTQIKQYWLWHLGSDSGKQLKELKDLFLFLLKLSRAEIWYCCILPDEKKQGPQIFGWRNVKKLRVLQFQARQIQWIFYWKRLEWGQILPWLVHEGNRMNYRVTEFWCISARWKNCSLWQQNLTMVSCLQQTSHKAKKVWDEYLNAMTQEYANKDEATDNMARLLSDCITSKYRHMTPSKTQSNRCPATPSRNSPMQHNVNNFHSLQIEPATTEDIEASFDSPHTAPSMRNGASPAGIVAVDPTILNERNSQIARMHLQIQHLQQQVKLPIVIFLHFLNFSALSVPMNICVLHL